MLGDFDSGAAITIDRTHIYGGFAAFAAAAIVFIVSRFVIGLLTRAGRGVLTVAETIGPVIAVAAIAWYIGVDGATRNTIWLGVEEHVAHAKRIAREHGWILL